MKSKKILILGRQDNHEIPKAIIELGYFPVTRGSVILCYEQLRSRCIDAVVVERDFTHADVLEFVLNVRDLNRSVPIIVFGCSGGARHEHKLASLKSLILLDVPIEDQRQKDKVKVLLQRALEVHLN